MSSTLSPPTLIMNSSGTRQQVPLRDYLNARIAPFLKKAMTESLASEAEFPLQWLGECLIHQSMLYEGNPDTTNIRERFRYNFDLPPAPVEEEPQPAVPAPPNGIESTEQAPVDLAAQAAAAVPVPAADATMVNGEQPMATEQVATEQVVTETETETKTEEALPAQSEQPAAAPTQDVDMAGST